MTSLVSIASLLFFSNKILLLLGKKINKQIGWLCGTFGAILFIIYFFIIGTPILSVLEIGLTTLMAYRFWAGEKTNKIIENGLGILTGLIIIVLTILAEQGMMSLAQFSGAFGMLVGTYLLISAKQIEDITTEERYGWLLYGLGHLCTSFIGYEKQEWVFFIFQYWQMLLCFGGFVAYTKEKRKIITMTVLGLGIIVSWTLIIFISKIN
jgi:hypothetical protein